MRRVVGKGEKDCGTDDEKEGEKDGEKDGQGTFTYFNVDVYVGEFQNAARHGQGTYTESDGSKLVGEFKDNNPWKATHYDKDGNAIATISEGVRFDGVRQEN